MELLLNLAWVLLALPAYWLWRRDAGLRSARWVSSLQCLLALGCVLVLLFPVISASDDLHAMRAEMEDSSISKRTVRQAGSEKNSAWVNRLQGVPAAVASAVWLVTPEVGRLEVSVRGLSPLVRACVFYGGRAPPFSLLG
jgi:cytochrome bd-type quinol oxidase subunit 2